MSKSFGEEMSQVDVSNNSLSEPEPQKSTEDKSSREEKTLVHNKDMSSGEPWSDANTTNECPEEEKSQVDTAIKTFGEDNPHVNATVKFLSEPETQMDITGKSEEQESQINTTDNSGDLQSQASTPDLSSRKEKSHLSNTDEPSVEEELHVGNTDESSGEEVQKTSTTDHSGDLQSQATTSDLSSRKEKSHLSNTDEPSVEEESHVGNTDESSGEEVQQTSTTDHSGDLQSQATTSDLSSRKEKSHLSNMDEPSVEEELHVGNTDESSGEEVQQTSTTDHSGDLQSQATTSDLSSRKEKSHLSNTDEPSVEEELHVGNTDESSGEEVQQTSTTDHSGDLQSQATTSDLSSRKEKSHLSNTDEPSVEEESHVGNTDESSGEEVQQINATDHSGDLQSQATTLDLSYRKQKLHLSNTDEPSVKEESLKVNKDELRQRRVAQTDHHRSPAGKPELDITDKSKLQSQERTAEFLKKEKSQVHVTGKASEASTKYRSAGEPESLGGIIDTESQKHTFVEQAFVRVNPDGTRQRHLETNDESQTGKHATRYRLLIGGFIVLALAVALVHTLLSPKGKPPVDHEPVLQIFLKEFASLKKDFPRQYEDLWFRSEKLLQMHLNMSDPSAPLILMLTAARDGERTLRCMSKRLAKSYADSLRSNSLMVNGPSMSKHESATAKLKIDDQLSSGFQSNSRAAVLHRLEMLPSGSLLILYKYCDHENAAFKKVALVITVLLQEESLEPNLSLTDVEEKVKDLLWAQFASSEVSAHNEMDVDKLSGVWSRISHVVLPVLPVGSIESGSCPGIQD